MKKTDKMKQLSNCVKANDELYTYNEVMKKIDYFYQNDNDFNYSKKTIIESELAYIKAYYNQDRLNFHINTGCLIWLGGIASIGYLINVNGPIQNAAARFVYCSFFVLSFLAIYFFAYGIYDDIRRKKPLILIEILTHMLDDLKDKEKILKAPNNSSLEKQNKNSCTPKWKRFLRRF